MFIGYLSIKTPYDKIFKEIGFKNNINPNLLKSIVKQEGNFRSDAENRSDREKSIGLGQINLQAWPQWSEIEMKDPYKNVQAMAFIINDLQSRYKSTTDIISAYNAGRPITRADGSYVNNSYVMSVYSRYLAYNAVNLGFL